MYDYKLTIADYYVRRHQTCDFREHATSAPAELGGTIHNVSPNRTRAQVVLQARKLHVKGSGVSGAFWVCTRACKLREQLAARRESQTPNGPARKTWSPLARR